jgi:hypothetical protein
MNPDANGCVANFIKGHGLPDKAHLMKMIHLKWRIQPCLSFDLEKNHPLSNLGQWQPITGGF